MSQQKPDSPDTILAHAGLAHAGLAHAGRPPDDLICGPARMARARAA